MDIRQFSKIRLFPNLVIYHTSAGSKPHYVIFTLHLLHLLALHVFYVCR